MKRGYNKILYNQRNKDETIEVIIKKRDILEVLAIIKDNDKQV